MSKIIEKSPAAPVAQLNQLDQRILEILPSSGASAVRPKVVADKLELPSQKVLPRLYSLVKRGMVQRVKPEGAPANGPGASLYRLS